MSIRWRGLRTLFVLTPHQYALGNRAEEIFFGILRAQRKKHKVLFFQPLDIPVLNGYRLTNQALMNLESDFIIPPKKTRDCIASLVITVAILPTRLFSRLLFWVAGKRLYESLNFPRLGVDSLWVDRPEKTRRAFDWRLAEQMDWKAQRLNYEAPKLRQDVASRCAKKLGAWGLEKADWYVCWHVRDGGFKQDFDRRSYRNANIENSIPAMQEITKRGGWVIRIGDDKMPRLPEIDRVIDYPFTDMKSDEMDIFLVANCRLFVGMTSGPLEVANLFNRQMLVINMSDWSSGALLGPNDRGLLKHVYSKAAGRFLSVKEMLAADRDLLNSWGYTSSDFEFRENSPQEIVGGLREALELLDKKGIDPSAVQVEAAMRMKANARKLIEEPNYHPHASRSEEVLRWKYKSAARVLMEDGVICKTYLEHNWDRDQLNERAYENV
jgi:putative glycosyltransferase (TIGR04372 family)